MADQSTCLSPTCGITVEGTLTKCPECGWMMRSPRNIRVRGRILIGLGLFLVLMIGGIAVYLLPAMLQPDVKTTSGTFAGTSAQALLALGFLAAIFLFGVFAILGGLHMSGTGRPSRQFGRAVLAIVSLLALIASLFEIFDALL